MCAVSFQLQVKLIASLGSHMEQAQFLSNERSFICRLPALNQNNEREKSFQFPIKASERWWDFLVDARAFNQLELRPWGRLYLVPSTPFEVWPLLSRDGAVHRYPIGIGRNTMNHRGAKPWALLIALNSAARVSSRVVCKRRQLLT